MCSNRFYQLTLRDAIMANEKLVVLSKRGFSYFFVHLIRPLFRYDSIYIYEHDIKQRDETGYLPKIKNLSLHIISSNQQADDLVKAGFEDFRQYYFNTKHYLNVGAVAFCFYINYELAHIGWVALTQKAKDICDTCPYQIDFSNKPVPVVP